MQVHHKCNGCDVSMTSFLCVSLWRLLKSKTFSVLRHKLHSLSKDKAVNRLELGYHKVTFFWFSTFLEDCMVFLEGDPPTLPYVAFVDDLNSANLIFLQNFSVRNRQLVYTHVLCQVSIDFYKNPCHSKEFFQILWKS